MKNIGGYDENSFYDSNGIAFLTRFLQKEHSIKALLETDDKIPNLDGTIQVLKKCETKKVPIQVFHVQVKTINTDYTNDNKKQNLSQYKYSADTKIFNIVKENITLDPVLLFLVDEIRERVYWIYVSTEYVMELQLKDEGNKTIYFNDCDEITSIDTFVNCLETIHKEKLFLLNNGNENVITTNGEISDEEYEILQKEYAFFDDLLSNKMKIVTASLYPEAWKFGIAYKACEKYNVVGIYQIKRGERGEYIKTFSNDENDCFAIIRYNKDATDLHRILMEQVSRLAQKYYETFYICPSSLSTIVLEEIAFYFLDSIARGYAEYENKNYKCNYYKDIESVVELRRIWNAVLHFAISENKNIIEKYSDMPNVVVEINPLASLCSAAVKTKEKATISFSNILAQKNAIIDKLPYPLVYSRKFDYQIIHETIIELENRNIVSITRPWKIKKFEKMLEQYEQLGLSGLDRVETGYIIEDIYDNGKKLLENLPNAYMHSIEKIWKEEFRYHQIEKEYSICYNEEDKNCNWVGLVRNGCKLNVIINEFQMEKVNEMRADLSALNADGIIWSNFYIGANLSLPLYQNIWYMLNKEMWDSYKLNVHVSDAGFFCK